MAQPEHFIHYKGITFARAHIIAISGSSVTRDTKGNLVKGKPYFTVHLTHPAPEWVIRAKTEKELLAKRAELIKLLG